MFAKIRYRLLLSYLAVLTAILAAFAIAVRIAFARSLEWELTNRLTVLAQAASGELDVEDEKLVVDGQDLLLNPNQAAQWFDPQGHIIDAKGSLPVKLPFDPQQKIQTQTSPYPVRSVTLPIRKEEIDDELTNNVREEEEESDDKLIGYVRVSESLAAIEETLQRLDWGLEGGIVVALALSGVGGIWLTRQSMKPIEESFQRLQQFTADASHELRNPLMAIKSNAAVALKYPEGMRESDAEKFQAIASATTQMTALTEDLLLLARNARDPQFKRISIDLTTILQQLILLYQPQAQTKQIVLKTAIDRALSIYGDPVQITRLFANLIDNALRYTPDKGTVTLRGNCEGLSVVVSIEDTGIGIAPDRLDRVFDRFWRADRSRSYGSGFGLGLAIARDIACRHGGAIAVSSQLGVGSCFTVRLPVNAEREEQKKSIFLTIQLDKLREAATKRYEDIRDVRDGSQSDSK